VSDQFTNADGQLLKIIRIGRDPEPAVIFLAGPRTGVFAKPGQFAFQLFMTFVHGDPDPVHFGLVAAVSKHEEELLARVDREHPKERADLRLDREQVVQNEIKRYLAVHRLKLRKIRKCSRAFRFPTSTDPPSSAGAGAPVSNERYRRIGSLIFSIQAPTYCPATNLICIDKSRIPKNTYPHANFYLAGPRPWPLASLAKC